MSSESRTEVVDERGLGHGLVGCDAELLDDDLSNAVFQCHLRPFSLRPEELIRHSGDLLHCACSGAPKRAVDARHQPRQYVAGADLEHVVHPQGGERATLSVKRTGAVT